MSNYNIISTEYSLKTEIEDGGVVEFTNKVGVPHKEIIYLKGHTVFTYYLGDKMYEGECIYPIVKVCTVVYDLVDGEIKATEFIKGSPQLTQRQIDEIIEAAVEVEYTSSVIKQLSANVNQLCVALCDKVTNPDSSPYFELYNWTTGPGRGAGEINYRDNWEYPVQIDSLLKITQAYYIALTEGQLKLE